MKTKQLNLPSLNTVKAREIYPGNLFLGSKDGIFMRVKPTGYLLNSTLICDKLNDGFICAVNMEKGTLYFIQAEEEVEPLEATLEWTRK
jgi:hypothetical protein